MRFEKLAPFLDERMRRLVAASESLAIGFGGTSQVSRQTGVSRRAIIRESRNSTKPQVCKGAEYAARVEAAREPSTKTPL